MSSKDSQRLINMTDHKDVAYLTEMSNVKIVYAKRLNKL